MLLSGIISLIIIFIDQISKFIVSSTFSAETQITIIPKVLRLIYVKNTGAAFSIFSEHVEFLGIVSAIFSVLIVIYAIKTKPVHLIHRLSISFIFAGAVGNGIDRIVRGYVIDFIETVFIEFPVFNIADIAITTGAVLLIIYMLFFEPKK